MDYRSLVRQTALDVGVDPNIAEAVLAQESGGNPSAVSRAGATGLMQLMPGTAKDLGVDPRDPSQNILGGVRYLKQQIDKYGVEGGLAAYNAGPGRVDKVMSFAELPSETQKYVPSVMNRAAQIAMNSNGNAVSDAGPSLGISDFMGAFDKAKAAGDEAAMKEIGGQLQQQFSSALSKAQAAGDTSAVDEIKGMQSKYSLAPAAPAAPVVSPKPAEASKVAPVPVQTANQPLLSEGTKRGLSIGTRDVLEGAEKALTYPVRAVGEAASGIANLIGQKEAAQWLSKNLGMKNQGAGALAADAMGLAKPETKQEKLVSAFNQGAAGLIPGTALSKAISSAPEMVKGAASILLPGTAGSATQVAKDVALNGGLQAGFEVAPAETAAGLAALAAGKAAAGKVIAPRISNALDERAAGKLMDFSGARNVRQDAEILRRAQQEFNNPIREAGGVQKSLSTKDLNGKIEQSFLREARDLVSKLPKDFEGKEVLSNAVKAGINNSTDELTALRNVKGGEQVADLIEAAQRTSVVTGAVAAKGGLLGNIVRETVDRTPAAILTGVFGGVPIPVKMGTTGLGQRILGRQSREEVTQKAIDKFARGANKVEQKYGLAPSKIASEELGGIVKQADNDYLGQIMGAKREQLDKTRLAKEATSKLNADKEASLLLKQQQEAETALEAARAKTLTNANKASEANVKRLQAKLRAERGQVDDSAVESVLQARWAEGKTANGGVQGVISQYTGLTGKNLVDGVNDLAKQYPQLAPHLEKIKTNQPVQNVKTLGVIQDALTDWAATKGIKVDPSVIKKQAVEAGITGAKSLPDSLYKKASGIISSMDDGALSSLIGKEVAASGEAIAKPRSYATGKLAKILHDQAEGRALDAEAQGILKTFMK